MTHALNASGRAAALAHAASRATETFSDPRWPACLAEALRSLDATWQESAQVCADVAWQARATGHSALGVLCPDQVTDHGPDPITGRTYRHLYLSTLRYDFRCRTIESLVNRVPLSVLDPDPYSWAMHAFARLGQSRSQGLADMERVLDTAGDHPKTLHVLLHGVRLGGLLPRRAHHLLALVDRLPDGGAGDPIALFRKASALRSLGRYPEALATIDRALELLPHGELAVHADLVRERALVTAAHDLTQLALSDWKIGP
ncbi:tetratricopeptide repeat protein [Streptomyces silvisoli]|uniref:Tetratricopeptide repeat protein n=1 Tax=Streptomyces silvisoli TaxID=3034235 RepID=A0ABT5ZRG4_9ACTN|nr:tetratricopeptide repeat protein [Streptomyces silvisoli]MDF3292408.1 tetratricopeptide repeat protein [Streptomyces silvisoli]